MIDYALTICCILLENQAVMTQIAKNMHEQTRLAYFPIAIDDAVMDSNDAQLEMMVQYMFNPELVKGFARIEFHILKGLEYWFILWKES